MPAERPLAGRTIAITGATRGIGRAAASALSADGARLLLLVRDVERGRRLAEELLAVGALEPPVPIECDLASFASVRAAAQTACSVAPLLDSLLNNAGIIAPTREMTEDGHEMTWQVNHLSHFLLTNLLRPSLTAAAPSRVVTVASDAHFAAYRGIRFGDVELARGWSPFGAYAHSKLANVMFGYELSRRWMGSGVTSNVVHPGAVSTGWGNQGWGGFASLWERLVPKLTAERGADTLVWLAGSSESEGMNGLYFYKRKPKRSARPSCDRMACERLWALSEAATGLASGEGLE